MRIVSIVPLRCSKKSHCHLWLSLEPFELLSHGLELQGRAILNEVVFRICLGQGSGRTPGREYRKQCYPLLLRLRHINPSSVNYHVKR